MTCTDICEFEATGRPWALDPTVYARLTTGSFAPPADVRRAPRTVPHASGAAIAILSLHGVLTHRPGALTARLGGTATLVAAQQLWEAVVDPSIAMIVLDIDSPGGLVGGAPELAADIRRCQKPIVALANRELVGSAYWIAAAADEIVVTALARVGGLQVTDPTPRICAAFTAMFLEAIAASRRVPLATARSWQGRTFTAPQAVEEGVVDRVATLEEVLVRLARQPLPVPATVQAHERRRRSRSSYA